MKNLSPRFNTSEISPSINGRFFEISRYTFRKTRFSVNTVKIRNDDISAVRPIVLMPFAAIYPVVTRSATTTLPVPMSSKMDSVVNAAVPAVAINVFIKKLTKSIAPATL